MGYTAYALSEESRRQILAHFPPRFPRVVAEHITHSFGVKPDHPLPPAATIEIYGYACTDGIEALAVRVNGETHKPDGKPYHITLSFDPSKTAPKEFDLNPHPEKRKAQNYKPLHSNALVAARIGWQDVAAPIEIQSHPKYLEDSPPAVQPKSAPPAPRITSAPRD